MTAIITFPENGRGAWPVTGGGGTLTSDGASPGRYFVLATTVTSRVGKVGHKADRYGQECTVDYYATFAHTRAIQRMLGVTNPNGIWNKVTGDSVKAFQAANGLFADAVLGPNTARVLFGQLVKPACDKEDLANTEDLQQLVNGHVTYESGWDGAAVGRLDSTDCGIAQLHLSAHPDVSIDQAFDPVFMIPWMARFVDGNLDAMNGNVRDAVAAYNLGIGGARTWVNAGRPVWWSPSTGQGQETEPTRPHTYRNMKAYIDRVLGIA